MPKNNFISQFFKLCLFDKFCHWKNRPVWNNTLSSCNMVPKPILPGCWPGNPGNSPQATHRRPHIWCSDESNLRQWNFLHDAVFGLESPVALGYTPRYWDYQSKGPRKRPSKKETLLAEWHQPTTCKLCFNIEQWKTTSCLPSKPCVGWFLDFVITSWSEFLKIFTFKQPGFWVFIKTSDLK
jgi:hypothetical protein